MLIAAILGDRYGGLDPKLETLKIETLQRTEVRMAGAQVFRVSSIFVKLDRIRSFWAFWAFSGHW
jgi:hypothetical protein